MVTSKRSTYSVREAAQLLGISKNSAYQACHKGQIPCLKVGRRILIPKPRFDLLLGNNEVKDGQ
jgi:excisionase family DNA binding protein